MKTVTIPDLKDKMLAAMTIRGLTAKEAEIVIAPFIEAELRGKRTHGINKFFVIDDGLHNRGTPRIIRDKFSYALIDGNKELGFLCADMAMDMAIQKAKQHGSGIVGLTNAFYFSVLWPYARKAAEAGLVSIIMKSGGPAGVAPFGGADPIMGINPLSIGIPARGGPIILDMAAAQKPWGEVNLARVENRPLAPNTFIDKNGNFTTDPAQAEAIIPFGGAKGYGLNLAIEVLTGAFVGARMGLQVKEVYDTGNLFIALSPEMFTEMDTFLDSVEVLKTELKSSRPMANFPEVYLPGEQGDALFKKNTVKGSLEIPKDIWDALCKYADGVDIKSALQIKL